MVRTKGKIPRNSEEEKRDKVIKKPTKIFVNGHELSISPTATCWISGDDIIINDPYARLVKEAFVINDLEYKIESLAITNLIRKLEKDREEYKKRFENIVNEEEELSTEDISEEEDKHIREDPDHSAFIFD